MASHLMDHSEALPERVIAKCVVLHSVPEPSTHKAGFGSAHNPAVLADFLSKSPGFPPFHSGIDHSQVINSFTFNGSISPNVLKAFPTEYLAGARNMLDVYVAIVILGAFIINERRPDQAKMGVFSQLSEKVREILFIKGNVSVQAGDHVIVNFPYPGVPSVERMDLPRKMPFLTFRHADQIDPGMDRRITCHNLLRAIG